MEDHYEGTIIDVPEVGFYYKSFGGIYECVEISAETYMMRSIEDKSIHPFQKWGWKKVG